MRLQHTWLSAAVATILAAALQAQAGIPADARGDWVKQAGTCEAVVRLRIGETTLTLINGVDSQTWGNVGVPTSFFGPDYAGITTVLLPDFDGLAPFTVYVNADEQKGVVKVSIYHEMAGQLPPAVVAMQAAAKKLAARFPLSDVPLKKC
jgi:hypothetical protein